MKKILICIDKIKNPNTGLGVVSLDFAKEIVKDKSNDYTFLVPSNYKGRDFLNHKIIKLSLWRRFVSAYMLKFDLVHLLYQAPNYSFAFAKKLIMTVHDLNFMYVRNKNKQQKYKRRMQTAVKRADAIGFISQYAQEDCKLNIHETTDKLLKVIHNGSTPISKVTQKPDWLPTGEYLFSIGVLSEKKNFHTLIPFLKNIHPQYKLIISGDKATAYGQTIEQLIIDEGLQDRCILSGLVTPAEKNYLYQHCSAFVFPSIAEGFGLPIIEAMGVEKPVFCSDKTSLKEIGSTFAFFWNTFDPIEMKKIFEAGMKTFENNPSLKAKQKQYALSFTWQKNAEAYINFYNKLID